MTRPGVAPLVLRQLRVISPTLAETVRTCALRAGLGRAAGTAAFILGNPKAWLGNAYHEVLEKIPEESARHESLDKAIDHLWQHAIDAQHQRAQAHPLDRRYGAPETWPGYHLALASVRLRARELVGTLAPPRVADDHGEAQDTVRILREKEFKACGGRLVGRPDLVRGDEVVDYKSGSIFEDTDQAPGEVVKASYVRQLRIYGYLVKETLGRLPARGVLLPLVGAGVEVALDPVECEREAQGAVALLDGYNSKLRQSRVVAELANPSPEACKWCPLKLICPAFWQSAGSEWSAHIESAAIEGILLDAPRPVHAGAARALSIEASRGTEAMGRYEIMPLNLTVHGPLSSFSAGERIRLVGLRRRQDGTLLPSLRTVLMRADGAPELEQGH